jgi:subtilisin family serine protease
LVSSVWLAGVAVVALVGLAGPAATAERSSAGGGASLSPPGVGLSGLGADRYRITLVTGDVVTLTAAVPGRYTAEIEPAVRPDGSEPSAYITGRDEDLYAIPDDVQPLIDSGRLDKELFNVGYLAANGYADATRGTVPVIAEYSEQLSAAAEQQRAQALPASNVSETLESIDAVALSVSKSHAEAFWADLSGEQEAKTPALETGVTKLWLDRKVHVVLDESVPQIGAPEAWAAGYDGTGVKVAVLDTGIDEAHPDVAGKVVASRSFISSQTVADGHGHGTHVAATVAGTGQAEGGTRKGVAPGAQLVIGKVIANSGSGPISGVIEGMEWASVEQDADVVNMSLGSPPTDGSDPASQAVDRLTRDTGTLFVISAGNGGRSGSFTVGTPGAADAALTVAAVNKTDQLADFSSRGPRVGDSALKPDIAAPGVGIAAARAAGTAMGAPVDDLYTRANGTSMSAPHVAGAAAILAQKYPAWTAEQLKSALMSTSKDAGYTVYEQGAGRLDVARAVSQEIIATTASVDFETIPFDDDVPRTKAVTYSNLTDEPVTLDLETELRTTDGQSVPEGTLVAPDSVTVPAGGTATVNVVLSAGPLVSSLYTGVLLASNSDGTRLTTPVGLSVGQQIFKVTVIVVRRQQDAGPWKPRNRAYTGCPGNYTAIVDLFGVAGPGVDRQERQRVCWFEPAPPEHPVTFHVPRGTYHAQAISTWHFENLNHQAALINPEFEVTSDTTITLDADDAEQIHIETPKSSEIHQVGTLVTRTTTTGSRLVVTSSPNADEGMMTWVTPTESVTKGRFVFSPQYLLGAPRLTARVVRPTRMELHPVPASNPQTSRDEFTPARKYQNVQVVYAGLGSPEDFAGINARGKLVLLRTDLDFPGLWGQPLVRRAQVERAAAAGAVGVLYHPVEGFINDDTLGVRLEVGTRDTPTPIPFAILPGAEADRLIELIGKGRVEVSLEATYRPRMPYVYSIKVYEEGRVPSDLHYEFDTDDLARVDASIHDAWTTEFAALRTPTHRPGEFVTFPLSISLEFPRKVPVYFGPVYRDAAYELGITPSWPEWDEVGLYAFDRPGRAEAHLGLPPLVPGALRMPPRYAADLGHAFAVCSGCRQGDVFYPQMLSVAAQRHGVISPFAAGTVEDSEVHLFREGTEITAREWFPLSPVFDLPPEAARYTLTIDEQGSQSRWEFTSRTVTEDDPPDGIACWATFFTGSTEPCRAEPLVFVNYTPELGLDNKARAGRSGEIQVEAYHHEPGGPRIAGLKLWVSTNDGGTWQLAKVKSRGDGVYEAEVRYPRLSQTNGFVSLKAEAWDVAGNRVEQTVERAFGLREGGGDDDDDDDDDD